MQKNPRWWIGKGIRIPEFGDFRNYFESWELYLGNSDSFLAN
jgi:hypothetical protein